MKDLCRYGIVLVMVGLSMTDAGAQVKKPAPSREVKHLNMAVIARGTGDSVVIRWAPASPEAWISGNTAGYRLTRIDISVAGHPVRTELGGGLMLPMPERQILAGLDTTAEKTKYLTIAWKMLYGKQYSTLTKAPRSFLQGVKGQHGALVLRYDLAMMAADYYPPAADALGLRFVDRQVVKGGKYVYLLSCVVADKAYTMDSASVFIVNERPKQEPVPKGLVGYGYDRKVEIRWNRRQDGYFSGYYLERSDDKGVSYHSLTRSPYNSTYIPPTGDKKKDSLLSKGKNTLLRDQQIYEDSIAQDYKPYYYRLRAVNGFGELSPYSDPVIVQGRDLTAPVAPIIDSARNISGNRVKISWTQRRVSPDLAGYFINRGTSVKGPFHLISPVMVDKRATSFTDTTALPHQANFYVIIAVDTAKNIAASAPAVAYLTDSVPPAAPTGLTGIIDSNGIVRLQWKDNTEPDLLGYQVYSSYNPSYQFSQITKAVVRGHSFTDTVAMNALDRKVYYKIVALDKTDNHSPFSAIAELKKPVRIPPTAPVAGTITAKGRLVHLEWIQSRGEGVSGYEVYRKGPDGQWRSVGQLKQDWSNPRVPFSDTIAVNTDYYYAAETIDSSGLRSARSFAVHVRSNAADSLSAVDNLQVVWNAQQHRVSLSWQYKDSGDYFFIVYRSMGKGVMEPWHSFEATVQTGTDDAVKKGVYSYAIKVVHRDRNARSVMGRAVGVQVESD